MTPDLRAAISGQGPIQGSPGVTRDLRKFMGNPDLVAELSNWEVLELTSLFLGFLRAEPQKIKEAGGS